MGGPGIRGLAGGGAHGFIPIDSACRVPGADARVHAAGDAAAYPIKHGGLGAQMADTAAASIAELAGAEIHVKPFLPTIRAKLLTGGAPLYISARLIGQRGFDSEVYDTPPWPEDEKVVAEELGPYLAGIDARTRDRTDSYFPRAYGQAAGPEVLSRRGDARAPQSC